MRKFTKNQISRVWLIAMLSFITVFNIQAQTTINLPAATACVANSNPSTNGTSIVSDYGGVGCTDSGKITGIMTVDKPVSGVFMTLYANVTTIGTYSILATANGVTFSGTGSFTTTGCQPVVLTATGTPTVVGSHVFTTNTTPNANVIGITVAIAPETMAVGAGNFTGRTCFDVALSNDNTNACAPLSVRTPRKADFTLAAINTQTYTFTPSGTVSNVRFYYINTTGNAVVAISGDNTGNNISTAIIATVNYNPANNALAAGLTANNALSTNIYVVYNVNAVNSNLPADNRIIKLTAKVKDCVCCGAALGGGGWLTMMCHNVGADERLDPFTYVSNGIYIDYDIKGSLFQWGRPKDGHENRSSQITTLAATNSDGTAPAGFVGKFSPMGGGSTWAGVPIPSVWGDGTANANPPKGKNDPCPSGYKVPSSIQFGLLMQSGGTLPVISSSATATANTWTWTGNGYKVGTALYLPAAGVRNATTAADIASVGNSGSYWSCNAYGSGMNFSSSSMQVSGSAYYMGGLTGMSVRCVAE